MSRTITPIDSQVRTSLLAELAAASNVPELRGLLTGHIDVLMPRFVCYHVHLTHLPRRTRRTLQHRWQRSLAALALLLALGQAPALAATIAVDGTRCTLIDAITAANTDSVTGGCPAGSGADILKLAPKSIHTLTAVNNVVYGNNGLPVIASTITIEGRGSTIKRKASAPDFRILAVNAIGDLTLNETTISGGHLTGYSLGGGVGNFSGTLTLNNCTISGNSANDGGGLLNYGSNYSHSNHRATITNSTISGNTAADSAGGIANRGLLILTNSTVSDNSSWRGGAGVDSTGDFGSGSQAYLTNITISGNRGVGVSNSYGSMTLTNCTITGNSSEGIYNDDSAQMELNRSLISGNDNEVFAYGLIKADNFNLFGHNGRTNAESFSYYFTPGASDITATSDGTNPTALNHILNSMLSRSGGITRTHNLVKGSPAVDAVTTGCPPPATDQRGVPRPQGSRCDIGAVELVLCNGQAATLVGTAANNFLKGTSHRDIIHGLGGNDRIFGLGGNDVLCGGGGNDMLNGGSGADACIGGSGTDTAAKCEAVRSIP